MVLPGLEFGLKRPATRIAVLLTGYGVTSSGNLA